MTLCIVFPAATAAGPAPTEAQILDCLQIICRARTGLNLRELNNRVRFHPAYGISGLEHLRRGLPLHELAFDMTVNVLKHIEADYVIESVAGGARAISCWLTECGAVKLATYLKYPLQAARTTCPHPEYFKDPEYCPPYLPFDEAIEAVESPAVFERYFCGEKSWSLFREIDRIRLLYCGLFEFLNLELMREQGLVKAWFPLKKFMGKEAADEEEAVLAQHPGFTIDSSTFQEAREYFGEYVAVHLFFMSFLGKLLIAPACVMTLLHLVQFVWPLSTAEWHHHHIPILGLAYAVFIVVWVNVAIRCWIREERLAALRWGQTDVSDAGSREESPFAVATCYVSDPAKPNHFVRHLDKCEQRKRQMLGHLMVAALLLLTCGSFVFIYRQVVDHANARIRPNPKATVIIQDEDEMIWHIRVFRNFFQDSVRWLWLVELVAIYITIIAKMSSYIFERFLAPRIVRYENHFSLKDFKAALDFKIFVYKVFVNLISIGSIWRMTMLRQDLSDNFYALKLLNKNIEIQILGFQGLDIVWRYASALIRCTRIKSPAAAHTRVEAQLQMPDYVKIAQTLSLDKAVEFANVAMFSIASPALPLISLAATFVDIRLETFLLRHSRRPFPLGQSGSVGAAENSTMNRSDLLRSVAFLAILTNVTFCMLSTPSHHATLAWKLVSVLCLLICGLGLKDFIEYKLPSASTRFVLLRSRMELHLHELLWHKQPRVK